MEIKMPLACRNKITIKEKQEMIKKHLSGVKFKELRKEYKYASSTISSILRNKDEIMKIKPTIASTRISKGRDMIAEMEVLLYKWIREAEFEYTKNEISKKALEIFKILKSENCNDRSQDFKASRGWFERFKKRFKLDDKSSPIELVFNENVKSECDSVDGVVTDEQNDDVKDNDEDDYPPTGISPEMLNSLINAWDLVKELVVHHPNLEMAEHACAFFETAIMKYFRTFQSVEVQHTNTDSNYNSSHRCQNEICECFPIKVEIEQ